MIGPRYAFGKLSCVRRYETRSKTKASERGFPRNDKLKKILVILLIKRQNSEVYLTRERERQREGGRREREGERERGKPFPQLKAFYLLRG